MLNDLDVLCQGKISQLSAKTKKPANQWRAW
jgi:hypothetical protein